MGGKVYFQLTIQGYSLPWRSQSDKGLGLRLHYTWVKKKRRRLVLSSLSAFHTVQHPSQQMVPPTVCSTSHASFNLIKKPHRHAQKRISLVTLDPPRSLLTEPPASLPFLVSRGSLYSLAGSSPLPSDLNVSNMTLSAYLIPSLWRQAALSCFDPLPPFLDLQRYLRPPKGLTQSPLLESLNLTLCQSQEVHLCYLQGLSQQRWLWWIRLGYGCLWKAERVTRGLRVILWPQRNLGFTSLKTLTLWGTLIRTRFINIKLL